MDIYIYIYLHLYNRSIQDIHYIFIKNYNLLFSIILKYNEKNLKMFLIKFRVFRFIIIFKTHKNNIVYYVYVYIYFKNDILSLELN